jgi:hypothetical protein
MSTWGQLRLQLQTSAPGVSLDLIDEYLNTTYEQVLEATDWQGLKYHATVQTQAAYQSGTDTVTLTVGSAAVAGVATTWTTALVGQKFYRPGDSVIYTVTAVADNLDLTLDRPYEGNGVDAAATVYSASSYVFMQNVYAMPSDVRSIASILNPVTELPLGKMSKDQLDQSAGPRTLVSEPTMYAPIEDSNEASPPVIKQIELYPPPLYARGFVVEYVHTATGFDGGNTSGSPLPFISDTVLLAGCRAKIAVYLKDNASALLYKAEFREEKDQLLLVEFSQRRVKTPIRMASRFIRHRMARASRGRNNNWGVGQGGPN